MKLRQLKLQRDRHLRWLVNLRKFAHDYAEYLYNQNNRPGFMRRYLSRVDDTLDDRYVVDVECIMRKEQQ